MRTAVLGVLVVFLSASLVSQTSDDDARETSRDGVRTYALPEIDLTRVPRTWRWEAEVEVTADGHVGAIHKLTQDEWFTEMNVAKWTFVPRGGNQGRWHKVTILLEQDVDSPGTPSVEAWYESPFTLHVWRRMPLIAHLPRVDGSIPERWCEVHHELMKVELVPIFACGGPGTPIVSMPIPPVELFPNVSYVPPESEAYGRFASFEAYRCASCWKAYCEWRWAHPEDPFGQ
jgi:hypothetical protein